VVSAARFGAAADGAADDTAALARALAAAAPGGDVYLGPGTYLVSSTLSMSSGQRLRMDAAATIKAAPTMTGVPILDLHTVSNVTVEGGAIDGNRANNANGTLLGIRVYGSCSNVRLVNVNVKGVPADSTGGSSGDGIYVGTAAGSGLVPDGVLVQGCKVTDCVRNGVSVTGGRNVRIAVSDFTDAAGSAPGAAIDIEPNSVLDPCEKISVVGNTGRSTFHGVLITGAGV